MKFQTNHMHRRSLPDWKLAVNLQESAYSRHAALLGDDDSRR